MVENHDIFHEEIVSFSFNVIMPNHLHALIAFCNTGKNINKIIGNCKRFLAYHIVAKIRQY